MISREHVFASDATLSENENQSFDNVIHDRGRFSAQSVQYIDKMFSRE